MKKPDTNEKSNEKRDSHRMVTMRSIERMDSERSH